MNTDYQMQGLWDRLRHHYPKHPSERFQFCLPLQEGGAQRIVPWLFGWWLECELKAAGAAAVGYRLDESERILAYRLDAFLESRYRWGVISERLHASIVRLEPGGKLKIEILDQSGRVVVADPTRFGPPQGVIDRIVYGPKGRPVMLGFTP